MSVLMNEIRNIHSKTADQLRRANIVTDSDIRSLTRADLNELLPGLENLKLRKTIFEKIHKQKPVDVLLKELKDFIPHDSLRDALTNNGVLVDYLHILKDMKNQMNHVQEFLDAHIDFLEEIRKNPPKQKLDQGSGGPNISHPVASGPKSDSGQGNPQKTQVSQSISGPNTSGSVFGRAPKTRVTVRYKVVISGKTFGAEQQLLEAVEAFNQQNEQVWLNLERSEINEDDYDVTIVFCPIVSRVGTDVDAALKMVEDNKPVILVLMHYAYEAKPVTSMRTWSNQTKVVFHVSVFYHETMRGLFKCCQNNEAVSEVRKELLKHSRQTPDDVRWNAEALERCNRDRNTSASGFRKTSESGTGLLSWAFGSKH